ncbi:MAG: ribulose-phosphate 3-epimerase [Thermodesulfobacteriota bacterium]
MKKLIVPSILSCDFTRLKEEIDEIKTAGADWIHVDVMDGHFVPNISIGIPIVEALKNINPPPMDIHLMIENPDDYVSKFIEAGKPHVKLITVQIESCRLLYSTISKIKSQGVMAGIAINPATPLGAIAEVIDLVDLVLVMTVEPGFGGQKFINAMLPKIKELRTIIDNKNGNKPLLEVDGGIKLDNIKDVVMAGADVIVSGSGIYKSANYKKTIDNMREIIDSV